MSDLIKEAEKNVLKTAKELEMAQLYIDALTEFGRTVFTDDNNRTQFFEGVYSIRTAVYNLYCKSILNCFLFSSVGGDEMKEYQKNKFMETFSNESRVNIMRFLEEWGRIPNGWRVDKEKQFKEEAQKEIDNF